MSQDWAERRGRGRLRWRLGSGGLRRKATMFPPPVGVELLPWALEPGRTEYINPEVEGKV